MIYISTTIEPKDLDEFEILSISLARKEEENDKGESKYVYAGWYQDREGEKHYFNNEIYIDRNVVVMELVGKICFDAAGINYL